MPPKKGAMDWVLDGRGYSTTLTPAVARRLVREHRSGDWPQMTAVKCGVHPGSLASYIKKGLEEAAIEPYASFAAEFLRVEADYSQRLLDVIVDAALGRRPAVRLDEHGHPLPRPNVTEAKWLLQTRFAVLWGGGGVSAIAMFSGGDDPVRRQKALEVLTSLSPDQKEHARQAGFVIPSTAQLPAGAPAVRPRFARTGPGSHVG
jgi:hypothetical protein